MFSEHRAESRKRYTIFISAWAAERIIGAEAGAQSRKYFIKQYNKNKGYEAGQPLESVRKTGKAESALMYYYGVIVWEQLRRKIGDKALFAGLREFYWDMSVL